MNVQPPTRKQFEEARIREALNFAPPIFACKKCKWPVVDGYCCPTCGDNSPRTTLEEDAEFERNS